jgi:capsular exopolysaccharide synthesis family protein
MTNNEIGLFDRRGGLPMLAPAARLSPEFLYEPETADLFDLRTIWSAVRRHRQLVIGIVAASLMLGVVSLFLMQPTYRASASIEIDNQPTKVLGTEDFQPVNGQQEADRLLQTQIDILKSRELAERVTDGLNLAADDRFLKSEKISPKPGIQREQVIKALRENLIVSLPRNSRVVPVSFDSSDSRLSAMIANSYAEHLISGNLQRHFDSSRYSKDFLENQLAVTKARLEQSERALLDYARSVGIIDPSAGGGDPDSSTNNAPRSLTSANLIDINQSLAQARANRIQAEGRWRLAQATPLMSLPDVLTNPAIQQMSQKRAELEANYQEELQHRQPDHPAVKQAAAAIRELDRQITTLAGGIRNSIRNQFETAKSQEGQMSGEVGQLKGATMAEQQLGVRYNILKREVQTNRELYNGLLQRFKEVSAEAGVTSNNISVIDRAVPPLLPVSPVPLVNMALALLLGLVVAAAAVTVLEMFSDGIRSPEDVESRFGFALLGAIPRLPKNTSLDAALADGRSGISEAYQTVRASVELSKQGGLPKTIAITSCREAEGKTTTAMAMARDAAAAGRKILLIDGDMRRPSLHHHFGLDNKTGLSSYLANEPMAENAAIFETQFDNLSVMPSGPRPPRPAELLAGAALRSFLTFLGDKYDQIIVDCPPVLGLADAPRIASVVEGTILVIEANRSQRGAVTAAARRLFAAQANIIGSIVTKFDPKTADVGSAYMLEYYQYGAEEAAAA